jgi:maleate cis-trans isomerase
MKQSADVQIGHLTTGSAYRPHYPNFEKLLPPGVKVVFGGLNLVGRSRSDLEGRSDEVARQALTFSQKYSLQGMVISGAPLSVFNPGLDAALAQTLAIPVATPLPSSAAALSALGARNLLVMTPFREDVNAELKIHLREAGFDVVAFPLFEDPTADAGTKVTPSELFARVVATFDALKDSDAIYFQGASMDPLPIIQQLEDRLGVPVIASSCAMLWCLLSRLGREYSITGYGKLLASWPIYES